MRKTILILIDGMRPDAFESCGHPFTEEMKRLGSYSLKARTVFPSVTLPCHLSLFYSVPPARHGTFSNDFVPTSHPMNGLLEQAFNAGLTTAMFHSWEQLRDISRPGSLHWCEMIEEHTAPSTDDLLTERALLRLQESRPDFLFLYLGETDGKGGHGYGWMSGEYLGYVKNAIEDVKRVYDAAHEEYSIIVTADHGGHERLHGTELPEDMTIPMFLIGPEFLPGRELEDVSIMDIAPTIARILGIRVPVEWEGKDLANQPHG